MEMDGASLLEPSTSVDATEQVVLEGTADPTSPVQDGITVHPTPPYDKYSVLELRTEVYRRGCKVIKTGPKKNANKQGYQDLLTRHDIISSQYDDQDTPTPTKAPKRSKHCMFRLINVIFSDKCYPRFIEIGSAPSRRELDVGAISDRSAYWNFIEMEFASKDSMYNVLVSQNEMFQEIQPQKAKAHIAKKLRSMWAEVIGMYTFYSIFIKSMSQVYTMVIVKTLACQAPTTMNSGTFAKGNLMFSIFIVGSRFALVFWKVSSVMWMLKTNWTRRMSAVTANPSDAD